MEAHAQTMLTPTPVPVGLVLLAFTAKPTSLIALKGVYVCVYFSHGDFFFITASALPIHTRL